MDHAVLVLSVSHRWNPRLQVCYAGFVSCVLLVVSVAQLLQQS